MTSNKADATYMMGRTEAETQRLIKQARLLGRATRHLFAEAGIGPGMRVLDVGSGAGDVALLAAELVGPTGAIVGVDLNPAVLETARARAVAAGFTQVTFVAGDFRTATLDGPFDAVVGRLVLQYVADPIAALRGLVDRLKPGGIVAFLEGEFELNRAYVDSRLGGPVQRQRNAWGTALRQRAGVHESMGFGLHKAFLQAGLDAPDMWVDAPLGGADSWAGYEWVAASVRSQLPLMEHYGIATAAEVDVDTLPERLRAEVRTTGYPIMLPPLVCAWVRTPMAATHAGP